MGGYINKQANKKLATRQPVGREYVWRWARGLSDVPQSSDFEQLAAHTKRTQIKGFSHIVGSAQVVQVPQWILLCFLSIKSLSGAVGGAWWENTCLAHAKMDPKSTKPKLNLKQTKTQTTPPPAPLSAKMTHLPFYSKLHSFLPFFFFLVNYIC